MMPSRKNLRHRSEDEVALMHARVGQSEFRSAEDGIIECYKVYVDPPVCICPVSGPVRRIVDFGLNLLEPAKDFNRCKPSCLDVHAYVDEAVGTVEAPRRGFIRRGTDCRNAESPLNGGDRLPDKGKTVADI